MSSDQTFGCVAELLKSFVDISSKQQEILKSQQQEILKLQQQKQIEVLAYDLWEKDGRPVSDGKEYWYKAEALLDV